MPICATPVIINGNPSCASCPPSGGITTALTTCTGQRVVSTTDPIDAGTGKPVINRMRVVRMSSRQSTTIEWVLRDTNGYPVDLSPCACTTVSQVTTCAYEVRLFVAEWVAAPSVKTYVGTIKTANNGTTSVTIPDTDSLAPGIYFAEIALVKKAVAAVGQLPAQPEFIEFTNQFYLYVNRGLTAGATYLLSGPPTIPEIRLHLRDSGGEESYLLDNLRFADEEIAHCIRLPIQYWNELPPPGFSFDTTNFPHRYNWLEAICGHLMLMAADQQVANELQYASGGVQVNDQSKAPVYTQRGLQRLQMWKEFVRAKKTEMNAYAAFGGLVSRRYW